MTAVLALPEGFRQPRDPICYLCGYELHHHDPDHPEYCVGGRDRAPRPQLSLYRLAQIATDAGVNHGIDPREDAAAERFWRLRDELGHRLYRIEDDGLEA